MELENFSNVPPDGVDSYLQTEQLSSESNVLPDGYNYAGEREREMYTTEENVDNYVEKENMSTDGDGSGEELVDGISLMNDTSEEHSIQTNYMNPNLGQIETNINPTKEEEISDFSLPNFQHEGNSGNNEIVGGDYQFEIPKDPSPEEVENDGEEEYVYLARPDKNSVCRLCNSGETVGKLIAPCKCTEESMMSLEPLSGVVLSVQSHVVHGYVGNKASCSVLQFLGYEVKSINSVHFSNHSGYPSINGTRMNGKQLKEIYEGLTKNNLLDDISHIQTGYIGSKEFLYSLIAIVKELKKKNKDIQYLCDPVIGDVVLRDGVLKREIYVPEELVKIYRDEVLKYANIITPNQMEAEILTGIEIKDENDVKKVLLNFHETKGIEIVVLTSCFLEKEKKLALYASKWSNGKENIIRIEFKRKEGYYSGVGDVIASLILAWSNFDKNDFVGAIEKSFNTVQYMVDNTKSGEELKVIQSRKIVENPIIFFHAVEL